MPTDNLVDFNETHIGEDFRDRPGVYDNCLFYDCVFDDLRGLSLTNCDLNHSRFETQSLEKAIGLTITLNCNSFSNVEFSPELLDLMLVLLISTKGNDERRQQLREVLGEKRARRLSQLLKDTE